MSKSGTYDWISKVRPTPAWFILLAVVLYLAIVSELSIGLFSFRGKTICYLSAGILIWIVGWCRSRSIKSSTHRFSTILLVVLCVLSVLCLFAQEQISNIPDSVLQYMPWFLVMGLLWSSIGNLRCRDFGLLPSKILPALYWTLSIWIIAQLCVVIIHGVSFSAVGIWHDEPSKPITYFFFAQLFGNSLIEELMFRAFLIVQLMLLFQRWKGWAKRKSLFIAIIVGSFIFAVMHVFGDYNSGSPFYDGETTIMEIAISQIPRFILGVIFAGIFLLSNNLLIAVGLHALANLQVSFGSPFYDGDTAWAVVIITLLPLVLLTIVAVRRRRIVLASKNLTSETFIG